MSASRVSHSFMSDELCESSSSSPTGKSSPLFTPTGAGPSNGRVQALRFAGKASPPSARAVRWSFQVDTKVFHAHESILPSPPKSSPTHPPASVRSYLHEQDLNKPTDPDSPYTTPLPARIAAKLHLITPTSLIRSALKARPYEIRVAVNVEEGTLNNKEPARLLVSGKRPKLIARDSYQLAMLRNAAGEEMPGKGKGKAVDLEDAPVPGSDDSADSDDIEDGDETREEEDEEEEETVEADGALMTGSLVDIILSGAEDLLTLEEAYHTLTLRLREKLAPSQAAELATTREDSIRIAIQPIRDEAPAMVRAMQRDLGRLMGKVPYAERSYSSDDGREGSPFRNVQPSRTSRSPPARQYVASPTTGAKGQSKPDAEPRQCYTEAEVRYRREAAGVGAATLKFLAAVFYESHLHRCFSDADLTSLLDQVLVIPRTPKLPTPSPKRTYYQAMLVISSMKVPDACVGPVAEKVVRAISSAMAEYLTTVVPTGGKEPGASGGKEGFLALINALATYPSIFLGHYSDLLPLVLRGMRHPSSFVRQKASAACAAFASAKLNVISAVLDTVGTSSNAEEEWQKVRSLTRKVELFTVSHLKSAMKVPGKTGPVYGHNGEKKIEANGLESIFKDTVGNQDGVLWACASWGVIVSLMGSAYATSGLAGIFDHIMNRSLEPSNNSFRPLLARTAWNHAIHAYICSNSSMSVSDGRVTRSFRVLPNGSSQDSAARLHLIQLPVDLALGMANAPDSAELVLQLAADGQPSRYAWQRSGKTKRHNWMISCGMAAVPVIYAYSGMALYHQDEETELVPASGVVQGTEAAQSVSAIPSRLARQDQAWAMAVRPILAGLIAVKGVDRLKLTGWSILSAITSPREVPAVEWSLDSLLATRYLTGEAFTIEKETALQAFMAELDKDAIPARAIPSWGSEWIIRIFTVIMDLFVTAFQGIRGVQDFTNIGWIKTASGELLLPKVLAAVWSNLLQSLVSYRDTHGLLAQGYVNGLECVTRTLIKLVDLAPSSYQPVGLLTEGEVSVQNSDVTRLGLLVYLFNSSVEALGKEAVTLPQFVLPIYDQDASPEVTTRQTFGASAEGLQSIAGCVLGYLLSSETFSTCGGPALALFKDVLSSVLGLVKSATSGGKLLGDLTTALPELFPGSEALQLEVWRVFAASWTSSLDTTPREPTVDPPTNHTGAILVSLLAAPFRGKSVDSLWHQEASQEDLTIWSQLLDVTVKRCKAKGLESNIGVLEILAQRLRECFRREDRTRSSTIALSCLLAALGHLDLTEQRASQNMVPRDFLLLLSDALVEAYPSPDTLAAIADHPVSAALTDLLAGMARALQQASPTRVYDVVRSLQTGLAIWLSDDNHVAGSDLAGALDRLYIATLAGLSGAIKAKHIAPTAALMDQLIDIIAPRLSLAKSPAVLKAFQAFWQAVFAKQTIEYSADVASFLRDVLAAVPGFIDVPGLKLDASMSEEESAAKYPHSQSLRMRPTVSSSMDASIARVEPEARSVDTPNPSDSLHFVTAPNPGNHLAALPLPTDSAPTPSPNMSDVDSQQVEDQVSPADHDVFGSSILSDRPKKGRSAKRPLGPGKAHEGKRQKRRAGDGSQGSRLEAVPELVPATLPPTTIISAGSQVPQGSKPVKGSSIFSAGKWLSKVPSLMFFSPNRDVQDLPAASPTAAAAAAPTSKMIKRKQSPVDVVVQTKRRAYASPAPNSRSRSVSASMDQDDADVDDEDDDEDGTGDDEEEEEDEEEEDEDELILSPETARKRRAEEEVDIQQRYVAASPAVKWKQQSATKNASSSSSRPRPRNSNEASLPRAVHGSQGRYDDAPGDLTLPPTQRLSRRHTSSTGQLAVPPPAGSTARGDVPGQGLPQDDTASNPPSASPARTGSQARILAMVEEAAKARAVIESMDYEGVVRLMQYARELQDAAARNLGGRVAAGRKVRRTG